jgi:ribosomal protein L7/L12
MKLDKIKFARLISYCVSRGMTGDDVDIECIDNLIDIDTPEAPKALTHEVDELLRCMLSANSDGFIPAIKAYRVLTNAGLKESKEAIERYRSIPKNV